MLIFTACMAAMLNTLTSAAKEGRVCFGSQFEGTQASWQGRHSSRRRRKLVMWHPQSGNLERRMLVLSPLLPFHSVWHSMGKATGHRQGGNSDLN